MTSAVAPAFRSGYCALPRDGRVVNRPCGFVVDEERQMGRVEALAAVCHERGEAPGMHACARSAAVHRFPHRRVVCTCAAPQACLRSQRPVSSKPHRRHPPRKRLPGSCAPSPCRPWPRHRRPRPLNSGRSHEALRALLLTQQRRVRDQLAQHGDVLRTQGLRGGDDGGFVRPDSGVIRHASILSAPQGAHRWERALDCRACAVQRRMHSRSTRNAGAISASCTQA